MNDPNQAIFATRRSAAIELRLSQGDWTSVCLALRWIGEWQANALLEIDAREDIDPDTRTAVRHAFRMNRRAMVSMRFAIENALNRKGVSSLTPATNPTARILVRHSGLADLPDLVEDYRLHLVSHPDLAERVRAKGYALLLDRLVPQVRAQGSALANQVPVPF